VVYDDTIGAPVETTYFNGPPTPDVVASASEPATGFIFADLRKLGSPQRLEP
jgi:hypothetical protein